MVSGVPDTAEGEFGGSAGGGAVEGEHAGAGRAAEGVPERGIVAEQAGDEAVGSGVGEGEGVFEALGEVEL